MGMVMEGPALAVRWTLVHGLAVLTSTLNKPPPVRPVLARRRKAISLIYQTNS
jgi:hypothetical protein